MRDGQAFAVVVKVPGLRTRASGSSQDWHLSSQSQHVLQASAGRFHEQAVHRELASEHQLREWSVHFLESFLELVEDSFDLVSPILDKFMNVSRPEQFEDTTVPPISYPIRLVGDVSWAV